MCNQQGSAAPNGVRETVSGARERESGVLSDRAEELYESCLNALKSKFQDDGKKLFYQLFENAYRQIRDKSRENKMRYWSWLSVLLLVLGTGGSGTVVVSLLSIARAIYSDSEVSATLADAARTYARLLVPLFLALALLIACMLVEFKRRNYKDTWVRHSTTYHRLNIAMIRHLSGLTGEEDFMREVLQILEADIAYFEHNIVNFQGRSVQADGAG